jgi:acetylornithine deacetylase/succinyl-diaminopimelate desuccinylase
MTVDIHDFHRWAIETPSHEDVTAMRDLLVETLESEGYDPTIDEEGNVIATRGGGDTNLVLNTHIDTVPPHVAYERDGDTVRGRGACDAKGPLASLLVAFLEADIGDGKLTLAISPNEETIQTGGAHLAETLEYDAAIVGEPTGLDVCTSARGQFEGEVRIRGESAHAADPASGKNAIRAATVAIQGMETYDEEYGPGEHESLGWPTLTPTLIEGGEATNQVPGECTITFDRRSVPPESVDTCIAQLEEHLYQFMPRGMDLSVSLARPDLPHPPAFDTDPDSDVVQALQRASGGEIRPFGAAAEAAYFAQRAPTAVFGPGVLVDDEGPVAHSNREYVERSAVDAAATAITDAVSDLLG